VHSARALPGFNGFLRWHTTTPESAQRFAAVTCMPVVAMIGIPLSELT
jgi:hypothetical protein